MRPRVIRFVARVVFAVALLGAIYVTCFLLPDAALPRVEDYRSGSLFEPGSLEAPLPHFVEATAYCHCPVCCGKWSDGFTAAGTRATEGRTVAADPSVFAIGTCLAFPSLGSRIVEDTGSAIRGPRIDVYFDDHGAALRFGRKTLVALQLPC